MRITHLPGFGARFAVLALDEALSVAQKMFAVAGPDAALNFGQAVDAIMPTGLELQPAAQVVGPHVSEQSSPAPREGSFSVGGPRDCAKPAAPEVGSSSEPSP